MYNLLLKTDSYKCSHWRQFPPGTEGTYYHVLSRGGRFSNVVFFGLQYYLKKYLAGSVVQMYDVSEAEHLLGQHFGAEVFNAEGFRRLVRKHRGKLPISIKALPEGACVRPGTAMMTVESTDPEFFWLPGYLETILLKVWYPCTVATVSSAVRNVMLVAAARTAGDAAVVDWQLHDFGYRGVSSEESAELGGMAHLLSFNGTDTLAALVAARDFYGARDAAGCSVPAAEHSTITSWGEACEEHAYRNMLKQFPTGIVSVVSDSYDIMRAVTEIWGKELRAEVLARPGKVVIRPDSGDPGPTLLAVIRELQKAFGVSTNKHGYTLLPPQVGVIQSDGNNFASIRDTLELLERNGICTTVPVFGMGGGLLQKVDRDTQSFAMKASAVKVNGEWQPVYKTSPGKASFAGRLKVVAGEYGAVTVPESNPGEDLLREVFRDGEILIDETFEAVRARVRGD